MDKIIDEFAALSDYWISQIIHFLPNILLGLLVFLAGFLFAKLARKMTRKLIVHLQGLLENRLKFWQFGTNFESSAMLIASTLYWVIIVFTLALVIQILDLSALEKWVDMLIAYLPHILAAAIIVFAGYLSGKLFESFMNSFAQRSGMDHLRNLGKIVKYMVIFVSLIIAADQAGINIAFLYYLMMMMLGLLIFGATLAFALGAKDIVNNILSSYYVLKIYKAGDKILIDGNSGIIRKITATSVILETDSGKMILPAKHFSTKEIQILEKVDDEK